MTAGSYNTARACKKSTHMHVPSFLPCTCWLTVVSTLDSALNNCADGQRARAVGALIQQAAGLSVRTPEQHPLLAKHVERHQHVRAKFLQGRHE